MPVIKARCPECDLVVRRDGVPVEEPTTVEVTCPNPMCRHEFTVTVNPDDEPALTRRTARSGRRRQGNEDGRNDQPQQRLKPGNTTVIVGVVAGVLLLVGGVVAVVALSRSKGKDQEAARVDPPVKLEAKQPGPRPNSTPKTDPGPNPSPTLPDNPNQLPPVIGPTPGPVPNPPSDQVPTAEDDVFARAAAFKPDGPLPELPPLPPVARRPILTLDAGGHTAFVRHVFFSPDSRRVITVADDKSIRFWDVETGEVAATVRLPAGPSKDGFPRSATLSPDGKHLAVGVLPADREKGIIPIYLISAETGEFEKMVTGISQVAEALDYSPNGAWLAAGCGNGALHVLEPESGKSLYRVQAHRGPVTQVRFNPARQAVASLGSDKEVKVWKLADAERPVWSVALPEEEPNALDWTANGELLAVACTNGEVYYYDEAGKRVKTIPAFKAGNTPIGILRIRFLPGDRLLAFAGAGVDGWAGLIDGQTGARLPVKGHNNTVSAVNVSKDGKLAVTVGGEFHQTIVWKTEKAQVIRRFAAPSRGLFGVGWSKDGRSLAWGTENRFDQNGISPLEMTLRLDDFTTGTAPNPSAFRQQIRDDGTFSVKLDDALHFTVYENGKPLYQYKAFRDASIYSVSILPGKGILVGSAGELYLLDARTGQQLRRYFGDTGLTIALAPSPDGRLFLSGSSDQVLRVWSADQSEPLLSIFPVGREWIAWNPRGYYACSPYGERLIAWLVNNGMDRLPSIHPAVRFRASMYQPAVIRYLVPAGSLPLAMAMAARYDGQTVSATGLADVLPPAVTLTAPVTAPAGEVEVKAAAEGTAKNPVVAMRLLVDGRPYQGAAGVKRFAPAQEKAEATWKVTLAPGRHSLAVQAESAVSKGMSFPATVTRPGQEPLPNLYVLAVGVSDYPGDMKLNYAATDAHLLSTTLGEKSKGVFGTIEVRTLTDRDATRKGILEGLDWLGSKMSSKDVGIFSFAGHGTRNPRTGQFYLVPVDVSEDDPLGTCLSGDEFKRRLENMPGRLVAILDACHSGAAASAGRPKPSGGRADNLVRDLVTDDYGVVVMCSSLGREYSMESSATKAGFFTFGLAEGLSGKADFNRDGVVYIHELDVYAALRVAQLSGGKQNPTTGRPPHIRPFSISKP